MNENNYIECNSIKAIDKTILSEQIKFQKSETIWTENNFYQEINQRKWCSKKLNKYVTTFDYIDKILIALSATSSGVNYFIYKYYWSTSWNCKCRSYFNFFSNNRKS